MLLTTKIIRVSKKMEMIQQMKQQNHQLLEPAIQAKDIRGN